MKVRPERDSIKEAEVGIGGEGNCDGGGRSSVTDWIIGDQSDV